MICTGHYFTMHPIGPFIIPMLAFHFDLFKED